MNSDNIFGHLFSRGDGVPCINPFSFFLLFCIVFIILYAWLRACYWVNEWMNANFCVARGLHNIVCRRSLIDIIPVQRRGN